MSVFPPGVCGTIRIALEGNLRQYHQRFGSDTLPVADLAVDIIKALKWVHSVDPDTAVSLAWRALTTVSSDTDGLTLEAASRCLRHSLTQGSAPYGKWTSDQAERFVTAALILA
ncbi:hypothetical protein [Streptomyces sp. TE33382]